MTNSSRSVRNLVVVFGDQLDAKSAAFDGFDARRDAVWMAEVDHEATHVWAHKLRIAFFFAAMRHFRDELRAAGRTVHYTELGPDPADDRGPDFAALLRTDLDELTPGRVVFVRPGDWRVRRTLIDACADAGVDCEEREDRHFYCTVSAFNEWADDAGAGSDADDDTHLVLENFYRMMRRRERILIDKAGKPVGGAWNFDADNRASFGRAGPPDDIKAPRRFGPDALTESVIELVEERYADHPGSLKHFDLPVTRREALTLVRDFVKHRLAGFGKHEDAMWTEAPFLYHSCLSAALNVKLIHPRECVEKAVAAYEAGAAPINSVEGFVRQILGWREFVRGVYWRHMPGYIERNALRCATDRDVPSFFWDGETDMRCVAQSMRFVLDHAYAHHIHRLMVLGLFAQLLGVHPRSFHDWHMAMYADAIDWVSLPNTLGMSQFGDGGVVGTKPYCASGNYISKMSPYCRDCKYHPKHATGPDACPFTTLYWDFLARHADRFENNPRMNYQLANLNRKNGRELTHIRKQAKALKARVTRGERV